MSRVTENEKQRVVKLYEEGKGRNAIAREIGRSASTVSAIAEEFDLHFDRSATKKASEAKRDYALAGRLEVNNELFEKLRTMVASLDVRDTGDFRDLVVSYGILTDKRRLDDDQPTGINESRRGSNLEDEFRKLDSKLEEESQEEGAP